MIRAANVHVPVWGLVLTFSPAFTSAPTVMPQAKDIARSAAAVAVSAAGATIFVLDASGKSVGGLIDYTAG